ncbi:MAG: hypothetical protein QOG62_34 [Thermoleophilaceae bacterium]|jgi:hypothetical protein|nr:hypothetical protein [Thermoleophilaceae bacterium]
MAKNEALFREANERMAAWEERHSGAAEEVYLCECTDRACLERVRLSRDQYEAVRGDSSHFVIVTGHVTPDVEKVIATHGDWSVVEKDPDVRHIVEATDPRRP